MGKEQQRPRLYLIPLIYLAIGCLWIWGSDWVIRQTVHDVDVFSAVEVAKGWIFVLVTTILLYLLIRAQFHRITCANRELDRSKRFQDVLIQNLPGAVYCSRIDDHRSLDFISAASETVLGYPPRAFLEDKSIFLDPLVHPEDRPARSSQYQTAISTLEPLDCTYRIRKGGELEAWIHEIGRCVEHGDEIGRRFEGILFDVTDAINARLENERLRERVEHLMKFELIFRLSMMAELRDEDTYDHILRMSEYSSRIALAMNHSKEFCDCIKLASPLHDIGKVGIPDSILLKPGKLTEDEYEQMKSHTVIGANILNGSDVPLLRTAHEIAFTHHEKYNGEGYPRGLQGNAIPLAGRIAAVADVFDALTSRRPYKEPWPVEKAVDLIRSEREKHFHPEAVDAFIESLDSMLEVRESGN